MKEEKDVCSLAWGRCEVSCVVSMTENHTTGFGSSVTNLFPLPCPDRNPVSQGATPARLRRKQLVLPLDMVECALERMNV